MEMTFTEQQISLNHALIQIRSQQSINKNNKIDPKTINVQ